MPDRFHHQDLISATTALFEAAGLPTAPAHTVAEILVEAELLGYDTHGLQFIPAYIKGIETGAISTTGRPTILKDGGGTLAIDGAGAPGQWAVVEAMEMAFARLPEHGAVTTVLRDCGNISCLATYVRRTADRGALAILATSAPGNSVVAPPGGREGRVSTNPLAIGIPSDGHPVLIDTSTASVSNRQVERAQRAGARLAGPFLIDREGQESDDPATLSTEAGGAILPVGGSVLGHKGFAFSLMVEALTTALAGTGRADPAHSGGSNVFLQLIDPAAFGGEAAFRAETAALAAWCRDAAPITSEKPVRMPGDRAHACWDDYMRNGVRLHPEVTGVYKPVFQRSGIAAPEPIPAS